MKIGVVSDTHSRKVPEKLLKDFQHVDMIIHAGDLCTMDDLAVFSKLKETHAVWGNMDDAQVQKNLPEKKTIHVEGKTIGIYHGIGPAKRVLDFVIGKFKGESCDVIVFGHSHQAMNEVIDGVLYFNPGSPNDDVIAPYRSFGILDISGGKVSGKIIKL